MPAGLEEFAEMWTVSRLPEYAVPGMAATVIQSAGGYILSAIVGVALVVAVVSLLYKVVRD